MKKYILILVLSCQSLLSSCSSDNTSIKVKIKNSYDVKTYTYKKGIFFGPDCAIITNVNEKIKIDCYYDTDIWGRGKEIVWDKGVKSFNYYPDSNILEGDVDKEQTTKEQFVDDVKDAISHYNNQYSDILQNNEIKETTKATWD